MIAPDRLIAVAFRRRNQTRIVIAVRAALDGGVLALVDYKWHQLVTPVDAAAIVVVGRGQTIEDVLIACERASRGVA